MVRSTVQNRFSFLQWTSGDKVGPNFGNWFSGLKCRSGMATQQMDLKYVNLLLFNSLQHLHLIVGVIHSWGLVYVIFRKWLISKFGLKLFLSANFEVMYHKVLHVSHFSAKSFISCRLKMMCRNWSPVILSKLCPLCTKLQNDVVLIQHGSSLWHFHLRLR